jgi:hypothetical protein
MSESNLQPIEISEHQMRTAMQSPSHLREWLEKSGRQWLVLNGLHLVDALPWPTGAEALTQIIACYRDHRSVIATGETKMEVDPRTKQQVEVEVYHPETLTVTELDRAIRYLVGQITELKPGWALTDPAL